jgi:hypothetical protein
MLRILSVALLCLLPTAVTAEPYVAHATEPCRGPVAYVDKKLQLVLYAETEAVPVAIADQAAGSE